MSGRVLIGTALLFSSLYVIASLTGGLPWTETILLSVVFFTMTEVGLLLSRGYARRRELDTLKKHEIDELKQKLEEAKGKPPVVLPPSVVTPLQKGVPLPLATAPPVSAGGPDPLGYLSGKKAEPVTADGRVGELSRARNPGPSKEAQAALSADLLEHLISEAADGHRGDHWEMTAEWLAEVQRIRLPSGRPLFIPRVRTVKWQSEGTLLGYPVRVSDAYGAPTLMS